MLEALLDSDILIDILRSYPPALAWSHQYEFSVFGVTILNKMEMIRGTRGRNELREAGKFLVQFPTVDVEAVDTQSAAQLQLQHHLTSHIGVVDYQIAAVVLRLNIPFYTRNLKHFAPLLGALAVQPY
jgi:predicted nucleic acid-binding protein